MSDINFTTALSDLYTQKGSIITNMEMMQQQLKIINQQIYQLNSNELINNKPEKK